MLVPDSALADELTAVAERLLNATEDSFIDGDDVARAIDRDPEDIAVYNAFREIERRGTLTVEFAGGQRVSSVGLPR